MGPSGSFSSLSPSQSSSASNGSQTSGDPALTAGSASLQSVPTEASPGRTLHDSTVSLDPYPSPSASTYQVRMSTVPGSASFASPLQSSSAPTRSQTSEAPGWISGSSSSQSVASETN